MRNVFGLVAGAFISAGSPALSDDLTQGFAACNGQGELSPSGQLEEGRTLWIGRGDADASREYGGVPFCTDGNWVERHGYQDQNGLFCTVGEGGLYVGHESTSSFNDAPVDPDTGRRPNTKPEQICRDSAGQCMDCRELSM